MGLRYLTLGAISAVLLSLAHGTWTSLSAQERFPAHPVHLIVPAPAGGSLDIGIRIIEPRLSALLGAPIVIVNRSAQVAPLRWRRSRARQRTGTPWQRPPHRGSR